VKKPTLAHRVQYGALRTMIAGAGSLGWERAGALGARIGELGYSPLSIRRQLVERHIAAAFPGIDAREVSRIARESYRHLGRVAIETALLSRMDRASVLGTVEEMIGWDHVAGPLRDGRGLIIVTGHFGNWELAGAYLAARGIPLDGVARGMSNPLFDSYLTRTRERVGITVIHDQQAVRRTARSLRENRAIAYVADQSGLNLASTAVPFFGRPAITPRGPAVFALRWNAPMIFGFSRRRPNGLYEVVAEPIEVDGTADREAEVDRVVARYTKALERRVRQSPEQYFWHHRRWKRQPPSTPEELRDPSGDAVS
jgi:KDO2-lipid IV(A) lauroyltransferase